MDLTALPTSDLLLMKRSMPRNRLKLVIILLALMTVFSTGCKKKRPKLPTIGQVPTIVAQAPEDEIPEIEEPEEPVTIDLPEPPKRRPRRPIAKKPTPPVQEPPKTIVNGGIPAPDVQISTANTQALNRQRESTNQLLDITESRLKGLTRQLSDSEQSMAHQIRAFITQSRSANEEGDIERAQVLANKAHLLCEELVKR
jgi:hypothetical protein